MGTWNSKLHVWLLRTVPTINTDFSVVYDYVRKADLDLCKGY